MKKYAYGFVGAFLVSAVLQACTPLKAPAQANGPAKQQNDARVHSQPQSKPLTLKGHRHNVRFVCFSADGRIVVSADERGEVILWDSATGRLSRRLPQLKTIGIMGVLSPDSKMIIYGDTTLQVWDVNKNKVLRVLNGHKAMVTPPSLLDSPMYAPGTFSSSLKREVRRAVVSSMAFSNDNKRLSTGSDDKMVEIWNVTTGKLERVLKGHTGTVNALNFSADSTMLASGSDDATVLLWNVKTGNLLKRIPVAVPCGDSGIVQALCFNKEGTKLTVIAQNGYIISIDVRSGQQKLLGRQGGVNVATFSGDRSSFALGQWEQVVIDRLFGIVEVGDSQTGKIRMKFQNRDLLMSWLALSFDGKKLATAGTGGARSVQIWSVP